MVVIVTVPLVVISTSLMLFMGSVGVTVTMSKVAAMALMIDRCVRRETEWVKQNGNRNDCVHGNDFAKM